MKSGRFYSLVTKHWPRIATGLVILMGLIEFAVEGLTADSGLEFYLMAWAGVTGGLWFLFDKAESSLSVGEGPPLAVERWAEERGDELATPLRDGVFPYDAILADVARRGGERLARGAAVNLAYPASPGLSASTRWPAGWWWALAWAIAGASGASLLLGFRSLRAERS